MTNINTCNTIEYIALKALEEANIAVTEEEKERIEVADFVLNRIQEIGLLVLTYVNTSRCCAKELILVPNQICPEHRHPSRNGMPGKEETFRCRRGEVKGCIVSEFSTNSDDESDIFTDTEIVRIPQMEE